MHLVSNTDFYHGIMGGCILGLSSSLFLLFTGQITGLSGIAEGLVSSKGEDWHGSYVLGLCLSGTTMSLLFKDNSSSFDHHTSMLSTEMIVVAGLLTGFGTRLGSGCTSGHGLCGLPRRSLRSLVAVATFMSTGAITAYICHLPAVHPSLVSHHTLPRHQYLQPGTSIAVIAMIAGRYLNLFDAISSRDPSQGIASKAIRSSLSVHAASLLCGFSFGVGLIVSGMCNPSRVIRFLDFSSSDGWDPTLMAVLMSGVLINTVSFHVFKHSKLQVVCEPRRDLGASLHMGLVRPNLVIDWRLLLGSALFGVGWGIAGICPGPGLVSLGALSEGATIFIPSVFIGMIIKQCFIS